MKSREEVGACGTNNKKLTRNRQMDERKQRTCRGVEHEERERAVVEARPIVGVKWGG